MMLNDIDPAVFSVACEAARELHRARALHGGMRSAHEGYAVILEELDELKAEVWKRREKRDVGRMREGAIQIAAMALRFVLDICEGAQYPRHSECR